ncbi:GdhA3 [Desulfamplus magnetovallimortis]|uniref:GdhA3 n=1 Tax=Desulfamplus magnetovallimortis TaxID=1246637 RepID=A0A1W1H740_9BACT|nr:NAD-glutamate dehydrogenase domain-containing protein [Desulfamplus magnetovallimortis]SLM28273.1 GdhA3 [Desulfamplus magnetovallimortis]
MEIPSDNYPEISQSGHIINKAHNLNLDTRILYEAVIDLASEGLITASCINMAAGILLDDLGLPNYFFENIKKDSLKHILSSIATSMRFKNGKVTLYGLVADIDFNLEHQNDVQRVRIATEETKDKMEAILANLISGHRREYYYSPKSNYYTYIIRPETVQDYTKQAFEKSRFLFNLAGDYKATPEPTRRRYENFLKSCEKSVIPLIESFNLPATGETRLLFNSDFPTPQLPVFRKLFEDHGLILNRAYWEPYSAKSSVPSSICSLYAAGELSIKKEALLVNDLCDYLSFRVSDITELYVQGALTFKEMLFAGNAVDFVHMFIYKESENVTDREIMESLSNDDYKDAFAARVHTSNKSTYVAEIIMDTAKKHPDLIKYLFEIFDNRFNPSVTNRMDAEQLEEKGKAFNKLISGRFMENKLKYDIFKFMYRFVSCTLKTNFYKPEKRSYAFRFDNSILDPLVFSQSVYGIFYVNGHYACGTHMRAGDISRGGLRLIRVTPSNHAAELDNAVLLNYALGPKAQRLKHKDICESGSKGVVVPHADYAGTYSLEALYDYTEGIMDLMLGHESIIDYYGLPEKIFFGPDEGTAPLMDSISWHARERGYKYWRTITTGKSFGIPHDTYGMFENGDVFGLFDRGDEGTDLQINGKSVVVTTDMEKIFEKTGKNIEKSGMTTTCVMSSFRTMITHYNSKEESLNLMMTGGPDGDLGANEIQCYKGKICLIIDGGSILFDPDGLDKKELMKIAFMRHTSPRANSLAFPVDKLGSDGFMVPLSAKEITLPDGTFVENGAMFHRNFLTDPSSRKFVSKANIEAFIPCGGFKDTINHSNVHAFLQNFQELKFIVEGANVFFDDASRRHIATSTNIKQIKDSSANKGGVFSSSIAEVLTAFLLGEDYEEKLLKDVPTKWALTRDIMLLVDKYSSLETGMLIKIHEVTSIPLFELSEKTSEQIFALQSICEENLTDILMDDALVWKIMENYIPNILITKLGKDAIMKTLNSEEIVAYRDAIITKKLSSMAFYKYGMEWEGFMEKVSNNFSSAVAEVVG